MVHPECLPFELKYRSLGTGRVRASCSRMPTGRLQSLGNKPRTFGQKPLTASLSHSPHVCPPPEPPVQIIGNSGTPEQHILVAGDDLILECEVSRPNCPVQWLWNSKLLKSDDRIKIDSCDVVRRLVLSGLQPSDSGKYICDAIDDKMITLVEVQRKFWCIYFIFQNLFLFVYLCLSHSFFLSTHAHMQCMCM